MTKIEAKFEALFNEAGEIASELNDLNRGRCDLLVWFAALKMAGKLLLSKQCALLDPLSAAVLTTKVAMIDEMIADMTIVLHEVQEGEAASNRVRAFQVGDSKPEDRS